MAAPTTVVSPSAPSASGRSEPSRIERMWAFLRRYEFLLITGLALAPFIVLFVKLFIDGPYANWGDDALLELQTRDVGRSLVWLGPYSRFGFSHPGPMLFYLNAIPYWLFGGQAPGMNLAALLINASAFVAIAWVAYRRGGVLLLTGTLLAIELFLRQASVGPDFLRNPWNPYVTVLPCLLFMFIAWELAQGTRGAIPAAVFVASFLVQTHLGYLPIVTVSAILGVGLGWRAYRKQWRSPQRSDLRRVLGWSAVLLGVLWVLPLAEQLTHWPGNVGRIAAFQVRNSGDHSVIDGVALLARLTGSFPAWLSGRELGGDGTFAGSSVFAIPIVLIALVAGVIAVRRRARGAITFGVLTGAALVVAAFSVARITDLVYEYLTRWMQVPTLMLLLVPFVVASDPAVRTARRRTYLLATGVVATLMIVASASSAVRVSATPSPGGLKEPQVAGLTAFVRAEAQRTATRTVTFAEGSPETYAAEWGVGVELERRGYTVRFPASYVNELTERHVVQGRAVGTQVAFGTERDRAAWSARPGFRYLGTSDGLTVFSVSPVAP